MVKVVLFDLGSTLLYFDGSWPEVLGRGVRALGESLVYSGLCLDLDQFIPLFQQRIRNYYQERDTEFLEYTTEQVLRGLVAELGCQDLGPEHMREALNEMYAVSQAHWRLEEDAIPTLERLLASGCRLGIISNAGDSADVEALVDNAGLRPYFEQILISANVGLRKPHPRIFSLAVEHFQSKPEEMVMVGDTLGADILGGNQTGMRTIWITRRADTSANRDHLDTIRPTAVVETLEEIPGVVKGWGFG